MGDQIKRQTEHVARVEERRGVNILLVGNPKEKGNLEDSDVDENIMLKWIFGKCMRGMN